MRTNIFRDLCVECSWTWKSCLFNPLIHSLSLQKKKERDKRPCNLLMKQSNLSRRTALWYQQGSALECSLFSLYSPFLVTPDTGVQISFWKILRNIYSAVSLAGKAHKICFIKWGTTIKRLEGSGFEHQPIFSANWRRGWRVVNAWGLENQAQISWMKGFHVESVPIWKVTDCPKFLRLSVLPS